jgi:hypothetical protein
MNMAKDDQSKALAEATTILPGSTIQARTTEQLATTITAWQKSNLPSKIDQPFFIDTSAVYHNVP